MNSNPIISVTGTKGKTTTVAIIADALQKLDRNVLKVDTTGHFVNGERRSTLDDSKTVWDLVPSVSPGRYLYEFHRDNSLKQDGVAVLECSLGCSSLPGLGYGHHKVGVFLNVFEDHLGSSDRLQNKEDIADAKQFIFERLRKDSGWAVFNADDALVTSKLEKVPETCKLLPMGIKFSHFDVDAHHKAGGISITVDGSDIILSQGNEKTVVANLAAIPWSFNGQFEPSSWNIMAAAGAIIAEHDGQVPAGLKQSLESVRLDPYGGRLTVLKNSDDVTILADYAHEKVSLGLVGDLARSLVKDGGRVIGVVRLAHDRTDELMRETAYEIAPHFDEFIVFDKIDGHWRTPSTRIRRFPEVVGRTSEVFAGALREKTDKVTRIVREDEAIAKAAEIAAPGDVVVIIVNDDIKRSIGLIQNAFKAEFA